MPSNVVKSFAEQTGKSIEEVEKLWNKAKTNAIKQGFKEDDSNFFAYVTGTLKKMLGLNESEVLSFSEFSDLKEAQGRIKQEDLKGEYAIVGDLYNSEKKYYFDDFAQKGFRRTQVVKGYITGQDFINYTDGKEFIKRLDTKDITHSDVLRKHDLI
jgi:hypothetical protein